MKKVITIETCARLSSQHGPGKKFHAQVKGNPKIWGFRHSEDDAARDLMSAHGITGTVHFTRLGTLAR